MSLYNSYNFGTPDRIRTYGLRLRKPTLYPAELRVHKICLLKNNRRIFVTRRCLRLCFIKANIGYCSTITEKNPALQPQLAHNNINNVEL